MEIEVLKVHSVRLGSRPMMAYADIRVGDWEIHGWRIIKQDGERAWVSVPQATWRGKDGKIRYQALITIPGELRQRIEVAILSAWEKEMNSGTGKSSC